MLAKIDPRAVDWSLYAILDKEFARGRAPDVLASELIEGGCSVIQLRDKVSPAREFYRDALRVKEVTDRHGIPLIINDRADIALAVRADGVHLGQQDLPLPAVKAILGGEVLLGASIHNLHELTEALAAGADYVGVGTIFPTKTKATDRVTGVEIIQTLRLHTKIPLVAIGGITAENVASVIAAGADGVAVISALLAGGGSVQENTSVLAQRIRAAKRGVCHEN
ncbi:MAG: thiamine phosphate synthase [bacterium]